MLEAPAGLVRVRADCRDGRCERDHVRERAVVRDPSRRPVEVPGIGELRVDVAYGGAFCAFVDAEALGFAIVPEEARELADLGERIRPAVAEQLEIAHPAEPALGVLSFVVFTAAPRVGGDARNATVVAPGRLDRCATGTATSARLAVLAARGLINEGEAFVNESVLGTRLVGRIASPHDGRRPRRDRAGDLRARLDHRHPPVRPRPRRSVPDGLPAPRHLGRRAVRLRVLSRADVERALDPDALVEALADAFTALPAPAAPRCRRAPASRCPAAPTRDRR